MAKRSTRIEVTKVLKTGEVEVTLNEKKMNISMCKQIIERLAKDCEDLGESNIKDVTFRCVE